MKKYENFLSHPSEAVKSNVGGWFDEALTLNSNIKTTTLEERKERFSVLMRNEIKFVLQGYHKTLLHYRD